MVAIPSGVFCFNTTGVEIEGDDAHGVDYQFPWEVTPRREHRQWMTVAPFFIDKYPVTNKQFADYLRSSGYRPRDRHNFLKHWQANGSYLPQDAGLYI